ncbi:MAG: oligopeptide transporter, OPT family [Acidobacteria bacterium]|nr:MAG: oligopeptide transporter, OPT family [Acidobacteriota bacterium]REK05946.1 MAG: oligopeptide transporter, OPT family [Acidobacteriota bacterium]
MKTPPLTESHPEAPGLDPAAYRPLEPGESYPSFVPAGQSPLEMTLRAVVAGIVSGVLFGAANAYLGLRSGLTISTSIPVAVLTVAFFKALSAAGHSSSILEANTAQTIGSASSSVASGVIFTLPALFLWGLDPALLQMTLLAMCGGLLGVLFMIPLRRVLIEGEHGRLPYPEGTACAEVLVAAQGGGNRARPVFLGLAAGAALKALTGLAKVVPGEVSFNVPLLKKSQLGSEVSAALFGVGFILGPRIAAVMVGGGLLSWLVILPILATWGEARTVPLYPETVKTIAEMGPSELWTRYVRYIGAGAVATGGLISLARSFRTLVSSLKQRVQASPSPGEGTTSDTTGGPAAASRTSLDLPFGVVLAGAFLVFCALSFLPFVFGGSTAATLTLGFRVLAAVLVILFAFFFVTVSSRIVGLVGVTSNPTSGMTIAALLGTSVIFYLMDWTSDSGKATALTVGCVVAIAASIAGDTSQDLKTGFLLGATPRRQQLGEIVGVLTSATFVCLTIILLDASYGFGTTELPAPQATLMKLVIEGVLEASLPWTLVAIGVGIAIVAELFRIPSLPFAVGVYLPVATMVPVFLGGLLRWSSERSARSEPEAEGRRERGVLLGSGLVGGTGLFGVVLAGIAFFSGSAPQGFGTGWAGPAAPLVGLATLAALAWWFRSVVLREPSASPGRAE